jgi:ribosomal protein L29
MKHKDLIDLRKKSEAELATLVVEKKYALAKAMAEAKLGSEKNVKLPWQLRREIAKISTIIREKQILEVKEEKKEEEK